MQQERALKLLVVELDTFSSACSSDCLDLTDDVCVTPRSVIISLQSASLFSSFHFSKNTHCVRYHGSTTCRALDVACARYYRLAARLITVFWMSTVCSGDGKCQSQTSLRGFLTRVLPAARDGPVCRDVHQGQI